MPENLFSFRSILPLAGMDVTGFAYCVGAAVFFGVLLCLCMQYKNRSGQSFLLTLTLLPVISCVIVMLVGNQLGAGIALAGSFSMIRFRSQPGTAREISALLLACTVGFACGAGYLMIAMILFAVSVLLGFVILTFGIGKAADNKRTLKITVPESLDYTGVFDDLLNEYTSFWECISVKTTEMGSLFHITYEIALKNGKNEKAFLDDLRTRNGNLEILLGRVTDRKGEL